MAENIREQLTEYHILVEQNDILLHSTSNSFEFIHHHHRVQATETIEKYVRNQ
jgi:hypothetical protein